MSYLSQFYHQILGSADKPKLVFLHGVMGFGLNWRRIAQAFENDYQILLYDQRGHGRSFHPKVGYGPENYAQDLRHILDELGWRKITLVGHSMGGRNALEFATESPQMLDRLVIEDIGPSMNKKGSEFILSLIDRVPVPFQNKREAKAYFDGAFLESLADRPDRLGLAQFLYSNITDSNITDSNITDAATKAGANGPDLVKDSTNSLPSSSTGATWRFNLAGIKESIAKGRAQDRWPDIEKLAMPTLLVRGELSNDLPEEVFREVLRRNPRITGHQIAGAGHWVHSDKPLEFIKVLQDFLNQFPV